MVLFVTAPIAYLQRDEANIPHEWKQGETNDNLVRWILKPNILFFPTHWRVWIKFNVPDHERDPDTSYPQECTSVPDEPGYWVTFSFQCEVEDLMYRAHQWELEALRMECIIESSISIEDENLRMIFDVYQSSWTVRRPSYNRPQPGSHLVSGSGAAIDDF